ncbi:hypothetical protein B0H13DRAFT_2137213 [Mycena leptocephala]|nr:hypothetical protein B0H13DRAFT_2153035 [Mycena leptocephala]KAJ7816127.1 hypothetical protein B0H13DRAFT_2137213 [Mycena leptocephala]
MSSILSLEGKGLKLNTRADIQPWIANVDPTKIEEIHFGGNTLGVDASLALAEFLEKTTILKIADFADIFTGRLISEIPLALTAICDALKDKTSLVELNLSDNAFGGRSVEPMVPFLTHNRTFQVLKLNNNGLGRRVASKAEGKKSSLRTVICGRNRLEDGSAPAWAEAFAAHGTLQEVRMPQNGIRMDGITALARGLSQCPGLQHIDLQDNTFTADGEVSGVEAWTEALKAWPDLTTLNLSDCVLSGDGEVPQIITALAAGSNPKLHTLLLQNNNLETETFLALASGVSKMTNLMLLELQWNDAEEDDENLRTLGLHLKRRGGKLLATDDDDDEDEAEEEAAEEEGSKPSVEKVKDVLDDLADALGKVNIK